MKRTLLAAVLAFTLLAGVAVWLAVFAFTNDSSDERWTDADGHSVADGRTLIDGTTPLVIADFYGAAHCNWTNVRFLVLGWPLGTEVGYPGAIDGVADDLRQYIWDPGPQRFELLGTNEDNAVPPADVEYSGYHRGDLQLWIAQSDVDRYVYLRTSDGSFERWPRSPRTRYCY